MKANEKTILRFLESSDTNFIVPIYQRKYSWTIEEAKKLYDDLIDIINKNQKNHFFGSIVSVYNDLGRDREYLIIDGQQRITTVSLLILALYRIIDLEICKTEKINKNQLINEYLINPYSISEDKLKLKLIYDDFKVYKDLYEENIIYSDSNIGINYSYFYNRILKQEASLDKLYEAINRLIIVEIELKSSEDNAQLIFESLNSTGLNLTDADKIRNFILMDKDSKTQTYLYKKYWQKIEENTKDDIVVFIKDYLSIKERKISTIDKIYYNFKLYVKENSNNNIEYILKEMFVYSEIYNKIINLNFEIKEMNSILKNINYLGVKVTYPFLMELFLDYYNKYINKEDLIEVLKVLETYIFRRIMCRIPSNSLAKYFVNLSESVKKEKNYKENYLEIFKYLILKRKDNLRLPSNMEFKKHFLEEEVYLFNNKRKTYLLEKLENYNNKERVDIERLLEEGILTIEHIMPQKLNNWWKQSLGDNFEEIHNTYLHTIGNLSLTGYNANMSNKSFYDKKNADKGFKNSRLKLNSFIATREVWSEKEILQRAILLFKDAENIWAYPKTKYKSNNIFENIYYLSDEEDFTNKKIKGFIFEGKEYKAKSFTELYEKVLNILYDIEPILLKSIAINSYNKEEIAMKISADKYGMIKPYKIVEDIYIEKSLSIDAKLNVLRYILGIYHIDLDELSFYI